MNVTHYIGFDVHKKHINFCSKTANGDIQSEGRLFAQRSVLRQWASPERELKVSNSGH